MQVFPLPFLSLKLLYVGIFASDKFDARSNNKIIDRYSPKETINSLLAFSRRGIKRRIFKKKISQRRGGAARILLVEKKEEE